MNTIFLSIIGLLSKVLDALFFPKKPQPKLVPVRSSNNPVKGNANPRFLPFLGLFLVFSAGLSAQSAGDALFFSHFQTGGGTARFMGISGAMGALGADFSSASQNPAGLAMYRNSEFLFTPSLLSNESNAQLDADNNSVFSKDKVKFGIDNVGIVFHRTPRSLKWSSFNTAIGMNRINDFNQSVYYTGDAQGSILNSFWQDAKAENFIVENFYPFGAGLAVEANAIYPDANGTLTYDMEANPNAVINRTQTIGTSGGMQELLLGFAGTYDERLMLGASFGIPIVRYSRTANYEEADLGDQVQYFDALEYTELLQTNGVGFNAKLGMTYRFNQMFRFGASFHTPTFFKMTDSYKSDLTYAYTDGSGSNSASAESLDGIFSYKLRTPWRATFGGAAIFGKNGFISADVDVIDYAVNRYNFTDEISSNENAAAEQAVNQDINNTFGQTVNVRLGGELALEGFRLRAGTSFLGRPSLEDSGFDQSYSVGAGMRFEKAFLELGYRFGKYEQTISPYSNVANPALVDNNGRRSNFLLSFGFRF